MKAVTGILLAGGQSSRMGTAKAFLEWHGKKLFEYPLAVLHEICSEVLIVTKTPELYENYSSRIFVDEFQNAGPLGGIFTGLKACCNPWAIVLACDMPYVRRELLDAMTDQAGRNKETEAIVPLATQAGCHGDVQAHPLCALYSKRCLPVIYRQILNGDLSLKRSLSLLETKFQRWLELDPDDVQGLSFMNVNRPEDVGIAMATFSSVPARRKLHC